MAVINNSKYIMLLRGNKGKGREKGKMKKTEGYIVKELEDELLKLRIENAFLKELRRLRLEDEAKMRERQESSAASEDSSN